jgi:hypothetical protein
MVLLILSLKGDCFMRSLRIGLLTLGSLFLFVAEAIFANVLSFNILSVDQQTVQYLAYIGGLIAVISGFAFIFGGAIIAEIFEKIESVVMDVEKTSNIFVWLLAFVPILGGIISCFAPEASTIIIIILNLVLFFLDKQKIEKNGLKTDSWFYIGLILIPVYLFLRGHETKKYGYAIAWCVFCIIGTFIPVLI